MKLSKQQVVIIGSIVLVLAVIIGAVVLNQRGSGPTGVVFSLKVWGTDPPDTMAGILVGYKAGHPLADIQYKQIDEHSYYSTLIDALASGQGPDVFYIGN